MFKVGDVVIVKERFIGCDSNRSLGIVYEKYSFNDGHSGVSIILSNGNDLGGFGTEEYIFLEKVGQFEQLSDFIRYNIFNEVEKHFCNYLNYLETNKTYIFREFNLGNLID